MEMEMEIHLVRGLKSVVYGRMRGDQALFEQFIRWRQMTRRSTGVRWAILKKVQTPTRFG